MNHETESRLHAIAERAAAATSGPWTADGGPREFWVNGLPSLPYEGNLLEPDAEFVAHAREDIPWLLDLVRKLTS